MRLAVLSDLHGNLEAVTKVWDALEDVDRIVCLGDIVGIGPFPGEVLDLVLDDKRFSWVLGNHDVNTRDGTDIGPLREIERRPHHDWVRADMGEAVSRIDAPISLRVELDGTTLNFVHRHPDDCGSKVPYFDMPYPEVLDKFYENVEGDLLFFGHTHIPLMAVGNEGRRYINPGAVGAENGGKALLVIVDHEADTGIGISKRKVDYDRMKVVRALKEKEVPYHRFIAAHFFNEKGFASATVNDI